MVAGGTSVGEGVVRDFHGHIHTAIFKIDNQQGLYSISLLNVTWQSGWEESLGGNEVKWSEVAQSCLSLCDPVDCRPPGSSVLGIFQARILEWVAISFYRRSPDPGIKPRSPTLQADALTSEPPEERRDTCICRAESLHCSHKTITTLLISYTPIQNKKFFKKAMCCWGLLDSIGVSPS